MAIRGDIQMAVTTQEAQVASLYVGYFNRAPDPLGLVYWVTQLIC